MACPPSALSSTSSYWEKIGIAYDCMSSIEKLITLLFTAGFAIISVEAIRRVMRK